MASSDGASSISVAIRVRPFTIREAAQLTKTDDGPLFLGEGSLAGVPTPSLSKKNVRPIIKVVDERCLCVRSHPNDAVPTLTPRPRIFDPPEDNPIQKFSRSIVPMGKRVKDQTFAFDRVFDDNTTQSDVYEATTKGLLSSVMDGYNATVFAYGATGCGKTHTITGTVQQPGIIFLTMQELFERISEVQADKVTEVSLSYLEIYNETIRDLLVPGGSKQGLMLREDANHAVSVAGLSSHHPQNVQEVMEMIVRGNEYRTMSPTEANATSSRSHAVLQVNVSQKDRNADINEPHTMATLSVIDLAGSERASATKNRGERLTEGANINKSLLALGSCINALCDPRQRNHVPYRNSKLTRLLKFSLGGNCKTVMIVCISPSSIHYDETQNTLRYANRAKNIQTKVTRNVFNVNRHVKDFLRKIDEQMAMINELKAQQKDYEGHAFAKFKKQGEKREAVAKEALTRLRTAYEHCQGERQERCNHMKKLRQIERRISMINSWTAAFDSVCETRDEEEPPRNLQAMRKTAQGILVELEGSRHHYHQRLSKLNWQRALDTALSTGLEQLQAVEEGTDPQEAAILEREAELLKANAERDCYTQLLDSEKDSDAGMLQVLLTAHFETVAIINQLLMMDEQEAVVAAKGIMNKMMSSCSDATSHLIRPDGSLPVAHAFPPTRSGTPKRTKGVNLLGPSPKKPQLVAVADTSYLSASPAKASPRRRLLGGPARRGVTFTPKKKSPTKRAVRWRDDAENGSLADYQQTPQPVDSTPVAAEESTTEIEQPPVASMPELVPRLQLGDDMSSSPMPPPPQAQVALENKVAQPTSQRFKAGFLSRKANDSPIAPTLSNVPSSSPEPSPLSDMSASRLNGRQPIERGSTLKMQALPGNEWASGSDSEKGWAASDGDTETIKAAIRRTSISRRTSTSARATRRRSPSASSPPAGGDSSFFAASQARRPEFRHSVLSPRSTPIGKPTSGHRRTTTMSDEKLLQRSATRGIHHSRMSSTGISVGGSAPRPSSVAGSATKTVWR